MPPNITPQTAIGIALSHHRAGRLAEAESIYRQLLVQNERNADALDYFGVLAIQTRRLDLAIDLLRRATDCDPSRPNPHCNLGECLRQCGRYDDAIESFLRALALKPDLAVAHNNLGTAYSDVGRFDDAIASYRKAVELNPQYAEAHSNLGNALKDQGKIDEALVEVRRAVELNSTSAECQNNLGVVLVEAGRAAEAIGVYRTAIGISPRYGHCYSNLGNALAQEGMHQEALIASKTAIDINPMDLQGHWNYAVLLLRSGDLRAGFIEYEWRWMAQDHFPKPAPRFHPPRFTTPHWRGEDVRGKVILLHAEQGFGDTIHFCRYAPLIAARGGLVVLEVHPELLRLCQELEGVEQVIPRGQPLPRFDLHCPLMSLPVGFGTTLDTIPAEIPYLRAEPELVEEWQKTLGPRDGKFRVGLCWAGSIDHADDRHRSVDLSQLAPLAREGVSFHSLQKGQHESPEVPAGMTLIDHNEKLADFADTAALIANLDLVITVDTAVAHLAGAMGKPAWVLLRKVADWRWLIDREDTPWYPTMRLFRQFQRGQWGDVIDRAAAALAEQVKKASEAHVSASATS